MLTLPQTNHLPPTLLESYLSLTLDPPSSLIEPYLSFTLDLPSSFLLRRR